MSYARGPYSLHPSLPSATRTVVTGSRKLDYTTGRYELDEHGNCVGMDPTAQCVVLAVSFGAGDPPAIINDAELTLRKQRVEASLDYHVQSGAIKNVIVTVEQTAAGRCSDHIRFFNPRRNVEDSVTLDHT